MTSYLRHILSLEREEIDVNSTETIMRTLFEMNNNYRRRRQSRDVVRVFTTVCVFVFSQDISKKPMQLE